MADKVKVVLDVRASDDASFPSGFKDPLAFFDSASITVQNSGIARKLGTGSVTIPFGDVGKARYIYLRGKTNARVQIQGTGTFAMRAGPQSTWAFFMGRCSITSLTVIHSSTASGRFPYLIAGVE